jgi:MFS family permease
MLAAAGVLRWARPRDEEESVRDVLRIRDVRLILASLALAEAGDWLYGAALVVYMLEATGSAGWVAAIGVVRLVPWVVFSPPAGVLADRVNRRALLVATSLAQAAVMFAMTLVALGGADPALTLGLAALAAATAVTASPAAQAAIPLLTDERDIAAVNAWRSALLSFAMVVGPMLGGLLLVLGSAAAAFAANAAALLLSAGCAALIRTPVGPFPADRAAAADSSFGPRLARIVIDDIAAGARALASSWATGALVLVTATILFTYTAQVVLWAVLADTQFAAGADSLTLLYAVYGLGGVAATIPATRAAARQNIGWVLAGAIVIGGISIIALAGVTELVPALALVAIQGVVVTMADVLGITLLQRALGASVLGRAIGTLDSVTSIAMVSGSALAPVLLGVGLAGGFALVGAVLVLVGVAAIVALRGPAPIPADVAQRLARLGSLPLFAGSPQFALEGIAAASREVRAPAGTVVIREGDDPDDLYVLLTGAASVTTEGAAAPINTLAPGDYFGEIGLVRRVPRTASVTTTEPSTLLRIDGELFLGLVSAGVAHGPTLGRSVGQRLARSRGAGAS